MQKKPGPYGVISFTAASATLVLQLAIPILLLPEKVMFSVLAVLTTLIATTGAWLELWDGARRKWFGRTVLLLTALALGRWAIMLGVVDLVRESIHRMRPG